MRRETILDERKSLYELAKKSHQERSLTYWEPMSQLHTWCYEQAVKSDDVRPKTLKKLLEQKEVSEGKLEKLDQRHLGMGELKSNMPDELIAYVQSLAEEVTNSRRIQEQNLHLSPRQLERLLELLTRAISENE